MAVALCLYAKVIIKSGASSSVGFADTFPHLGKACSALYLLCKHHAVIIDGALLIRRLRRHLPHRGRLEIACNFGLNEVRQSPLEKANSALCTLHFIRSAL